MEFDAVKWFVGLMVTVCLAVVAAFRSMRIKMSSQHKDIYDKIEKVKEDYVRRDDFKEHMDRQELTSARIESQVDKINDKIDRVIR